MLQRLKEGKIESLRQLIYDPDANILARSWSPSVASVAQPNVRQYCGNHDAARNPRRHYHRLHLVLPRRDKKAPGDNYLITGWHLTDPVKSGLKRFG
jgi:hypothetical protein